jgi:archaellum biogenesis ATPase FlaH
MSSYNKTNKNEQTENIEFNEDYQILFLQTLISDQELFLRCQNIIRPKYFDPKFRSTIRFILDYTNEYKLLPRPEQINAETGLRLDKIEETAVGYKEWFLDKIEVFCRHKEFEDIILSGPDLLAKGQHSIVEARAKEAMTISLQKDLGTDYFFKPKERLERVRDRSSVVSTGWKSIDKPLYGGWGRQTLNIFAGQPGAGKSLVLQNISINYIEQGLNVVYFTLELSEDLVSMRFDSMVTATPTKEVMRKMDEVELRIANFQRTHKPGRLQIKKFPEGGTTCNDLRAYLKEYEIQTGIKFDVVIVDYLDLLHPCSKRIDPSDLFIKDKYTSEELRALSFEWNVILVTASQLNRSSMDVLDFDQSHIAGGISKINTADNVMAILGTSAMREKGEYQIQFLKTRTSAGVGQKVNLHFDVSSLRLRDFDGDEGETRALTNDEIITKLKSKTTSTIKKEDETTEEITKKGANLLDALRRSRDS